MLCICYVVHTTQIVMPRLCLLTAKASSSGDGSPPEQAVDISCAPPGGPASGGAWTEPPADVARPPRVPPPRRHADPPLPTTPRHQPPRYHLLKITIIYTQAKNERVDSFLRVAGASRPGIKEEQEGSRSKRIRLRTPACGGTLSRMSRRLLSLSVELNYSYHQKALK